MKYEVIIEETNTASFTVEASNLEEAYGSARKGYEEGEVVLAPGECQRKQMAVVPPNRRELEWREF